MREGVFPGAWKRAKLALIPKGVAQDEGLPKIRPICLLDEIGKIFEYIIAERIKLWMKENPKARLSKSQYGFREGKSTCDVLLEVQRIVSKTTRDGSWRWGKFRRSQCV